MSRPTSVRCHNLAQCMSPPPGALRCPIDGGLARDAVRSTICGHVYGLQCILDALIKAERCPACNMPMDASDLQPADDIRDAVMATRVQCREGENIGQGRCLWNGPLRDEPAHANGSACGVHKVACPFCKFSVEAGAAFEQHKSMCDECIVICPQCSEDMPRKRLLAHQTACKASLPMPLKASNELLKKMASAAAAAPPPAEATKPDLPPQQVDGVGSTTPPPRAPKGKDKSSSSKAGSKATGGGAGASPSAATGNVIPQTLSELEQRLGHAAVLRSGKKQTRAAKSSNGGGASPVPTSGSQAATSTPQQSTAKRGSGGGGMHLAADFTVAMDETHSATPAAAAAAARHPQKHDGVAAAAGTPQQGRSMEYSRDSDLFSPAPELSKSTAFAAASAAASPDDGPAAAATTVCPFALMGCTAQHRPKDLLKPSTLQQHLLTMCGALHALQARTTLVEAQCQQQQDEICRLRSALHKGITNAPSVPATNNGTSTPPPQRAPGSARAAAPENAPVASSTKKLAPVSGGVAAVKPPASKPSSATAARHRHQGAKGATPKPQRQGLAEVVTNTQHQ